MFRRICRGESRVTLMQEIQRSIDLTIEGMVTEDKDGEEVTVGIIIHVGIQ